MSKATDSLRRVTSQMIEKAENESSEIVCEQVLNKYNEPSYEKKQSTFTPVVPYKIIKVPQEVRIKGKFGSERKTTVARSSQGLFYLLQDLCQYETASDKNPPAFEKALQFLVIVPQNANLHLNGASM